VRLGVVVVVVANSTIICQHISPHMVLETVNIRTAGYQKRQSPIEADHLRT